MTVLMCHHQDAIKGMIEALLHHLREGQAMTALMHLHQDVEGTIALMHRLQEGKSTTTMTHPHQDIIDMRAQIENRQGMMMKFLGGSLQLRIELHPAIKPAYKVVMILSRWG